MANTLLTTSQIIRESLMVLQNDLTFSAAVNTEYDDRFGISGAKIGAVVNARKPPRYLGRTGQALNVEGSTETYVPIALNTQFGVDISFSSNDLTLSIDNFRERFLVPAMATIANKIDADGLALYADINNFSGTAGQITGGSLTTAQAQATILGARRKLTENGVPQQNRAGILGPASEAAIIPSFTGLFNPSGAVSSFFKSGALGDNVLGFNWAADANVVSFTPQTAGSLTAISAVPATGATTLAVTTTAGTVPKGDCLNCGWYLRNQPSVQSVNRIGA